MTNLTPRTTALQALRTQIPAAARQLDLDLSGALQSWVHALDVKLLPKLDPEFPLIVAVCGGGSAGKSTLFNSLIGRGASPTGGRAGLNRRVLAALHRSRADNPSVFEVLAHGLGGPLELMSDVEQLTTPGDPVYCVHTSPLERLVLLDTPDIDTGAQGRYTNREAARRSLESADAFIYIFTNATYNNRDNTDFIAQMLTGIGKRPCYLVYRVYASFTDAEVTEHARVVARNLYGNPWEPHVLGVFRADDDNRVAAGEHPMTVRALPPRNGHLPDTLAALDAVALRQRLLHSMLSDAVDQARRMHQHLVAAVDQVTAYLSALERAQRHAVQSALSHFPTDRVLRRFADIWVATDPTHIRLMRRTGQVIEWPVKAVWSAARKLSTHEPANRVPTGQDDVAAQLGLDLLQAANTLFQRTVDIRISDDTATVSAPAVVRPMQARLRQKDWQAALVHIQEQKEMILSWSDRLEKDLRELADQLRRRMGVMDQIRQTFAAMLNVIPATAAVTYILHTGDPAGAVGIKVKLTGLLGLHDLYALIAIPATAGLKKADRRQMAQMLTPVAQTWLAHKLLAVQALFEEQITGDVLHAAREGKSQVEARIGEIEKSLKTLDEH
ncbi:MAG: hypothetical protein HKP58_05645 [Desulfatitalea sp.]|nr:50S ribosome-binding GTPase [Desulfatitalea sp.]NNJ99878.1 hypothetical protein [Desulfatitalea sp.]